jgi:hypothetical protein
MEGIRRLKIHWRNRRNNIYYSQTKRRRDDSEKWAIVEDPASYQGGNNSWELDARESLYSIQYIQCIP